MSEAKHKRRVLVIGAGYFAPFHVDAWLRLPNVEVIGICDRDLAKATSLCERFHIARSFDDVQRAFDAFDIDFIDIVTPPTGKLELVQSLAKRSLPMICQKPLAENFSLAKEVVQAAKASGQLFMVHENFRFQPWYRKIKSLLNSGQFGSRIHSISMRTRMGDGWGENAYLSRQPYFRSMPRLLLHETGIHFVDTFRYLAGEITECTALIQRWNPIIVGEDAAVFHLQFASGATATWDANRYNESRSLEPRYTFGDFCVETDGGSIWLDADGAITTKRLGEEPKQVEFQPSRDGFAGDCVYSCQKHFLECLEHNAACETSGEEYLKSLQVVESLYESAAKKCTVGLQATVKRSQCVVDLSLPVTNQMPGVKIDSHKLLEVDGWNATMLHLYSHAGTHMDAPRHFLPTGRTLDEQNLAAVTGKARVVQLAPVQPKQLHGIDEIERQCPNLPPGARLLFRTDWYKRYGTSEYRDELPRISVELARWLVEKQVALIGVEPPSVADVNNLAEVTEIHQILLSAGIVIVEGLANLDQLTETEVQFIALPLRIVGGDGCPVRAIAIEDTSDRR